MRKKTSTSSKPKLPSEKSVAAYLRQHPKFFADHQDIITIMELPIDESDNVISFDRGQAKVFRNRYIDLRQRMSELLHIAQENSDKYEKTNRLILDLLECRSIEDISDITRAALIDDFGCDACSIILCGDDSDVAPSARIISSEQAHAVFPHLINKETSATCGILRQDELELLFPGDNGIGSAAVSTIGQRTTIGLLAMGSYDEEYFRSGMGTALLRYVCDVLARLIPNYYCA